MVESFKSRSNGYSRGSVTFSYLQVRPLQAENTTMPWSRLYFLPQACCKLWPTRLAILFSIHTLRTLAIPRLPHWYQNNKLDPTFMFTPPSSSQSHHTISRSSPIDKQWHKFHLPSTRYHTFTIPSQHQPQPLPISHTHTPNITSSLTYVVSYLRTTIYSPPHPTYLYLVLPDTHGLKKIPSVYRFHSCKMRDRTRTYISTCRSFRKRGGKKRKKDLFFECSFLSRDLHFIQ
jgi:hypothetical protein